MLIQLVNVASINWDPFYCPCHLYHTLYVLPSTPSSSPFQSECPPVEVVPYTVPVSFYLRVQRLALSV